MNWWRGIGRRNRLIVTMVVAGSALLLVIALLMPESTSDKKRRAKSTRCTAAVNHVSEKNVSDGYEPLSRSEAQQGYNYCMDRP